MLGTSSAQDLRLFRKHGFLGKSKRGMLGVWYKKGEAADKVAKAREWHILDWLAFWTSFSGNTDGWLLMAHFNVNGEEPNIRAAFIFHPF